MPRMGKGCKTYETVRAVSMVAFSLFGLTDEESPAAEWY